MADEMHENKNPTEKNKTNKKLSIFSFFVFPQINKSAALKQAWRERRKETEKRWQRWGERVREDRRKTTVASLAVLFAFERLHQVDLQSLLLWLVSQSLNTPVWGETQREGRPSDQVWKQRLGKFLQRDGNTQRENLNLFKSISYAGITPILLLCGEKNIYHHTLNVYTLHTWDVNIRQIKPTFISYLVICCHAVESCALPAYSVLQQCSPSFTFCWTRMTSTFMFKYKIKITPFALVLYLKW